MRHWIALSLLLVLASPVQAIQWGSPSSFQGMGVGEVNGWLLASFDERGDDIVQMEFQKGVGRVHERYSLHPDGAPIVDGIGVNRQTPESDWSPMAAWNWTGFPRTSALLLRLDGVELHSMGNLEIESWTLGRQHEIDPLVAERLSTWDVAWQENQVVFALTGILEGEFQAPLSELYGFDCDDCPTPRDATVQPDAGGARVYRSLELRAESHWSIRINGTFLVVAGNSTWQLDGTLRMPQFNGTAETETLVGRSDLENLQWTGEHVLGAELSGTWTQAFKDERLDSQWTIAGVTVATSVGIALLGLIAKEILSAPLTNERRRQLYRIIQEQPGLHFRELQRASGFGNGALYYALRVLESANLIEVRTAKSRKHFYAIMSVTYTVDDLPLYGINPKLLEQAIRTIAHQESTSRKTIALTFQDFGMSRASAYRLIHKLVQAKVLDFNPYAHFVRLPRGITLENPRPLLPPRE